MTVSRMAFPLRIECPAKINLHLRVGPRRADGFHSLLSWMCTVGLFDTLTLEPLDAGRGVEMVCDTPDIPCDDRNLVVRVAKAFSEIQSNRGAANGPPIQPAVDIRATLQKRIPVGAGLGGGSSDAAHTIMGLNQLTGARRSADELSTFAGRFGSDLSFFMYGPSSICTGRGELVRPISRAAVRWAVLILPPIMMPTGDVYRRFDDMKLGRDRDVEDQPDWRGWTTLPSSHLLPLLINDLEPPAFALRSDLGALRREIEQVLGRTVRMSGSGSSLFTLFDERENATIAAEEVYRKLSIRAEAIELAPRIDDDWAGRPSKNEIIS